MQVLYLAEQSLSQWFGWCAVCEVMTCVPCVNMDYCVQEGRIPRDLIEYDFAEDAYDFEIELAEAREVKFVQVLTEPLTIGSQIVCTGTPCDDFPWFTINIGCGDSDYDDKADRAMHFNVRLLQAYVVRNTRRHDKWGNEETTSFRPFPFKTGVPFTIEVLVDEKETLWAVDGEHFCSYAHRNPSVLDATWVQVVGIRDAALQIQRTDVYPVLAPAFNEVCMRSSLDNPSEGMEPCWKPNVIASMTNGIPEGHQLVIYGRLRHALHSFAVDLIDRCEEWPRPNVHLHVNLRASVESQRDRQLVVLNAYFGEWGPEQRQRTARLIPSTYITLRIVRSPSEWSIYTNGILIGEMEYRASPQAIKGMRIKGDLFPHQIYLCPSSSSPIGDHS